MSFASPRFVAQEKLAGLTDRQRQVAELLSKGSTFAEIGELLGISSSTVKYHSRAVQEAMGVSDRIQLARALSYSD